MWRRRHTNYIVIIIVVLIVIVSFIIIFNSHRKTTISIKKSQKSNAAQRVLGARVPIMLPESLKVCCAEAW